MEGNQETKFYMCTDTVTMESLPEKQEPEVTTVLIGKSNKVTGESPRPKWSHPIECLCTVLTFLTSNVIVIRFPYMMYRNGGMCFLIAYSIVLSLFGIPMLFLDSYIGQFTSNGVLTCWGMFPLLTGVGVAFLFYALIAALSTSIMNAWAIHYFLDSFRFGELPWATCSNSWNTRDCISAHGPDVASNYSNSTNPVENSNYNYNYEYNYYYKSNPSEEYFYYRVLKISEGIGILGIPQWNIVLPLCSIWVVVAVVLAFGPKLYGKISIFNMLMYLLGFLIIIRTITLPNAIDGLQYIFYPSFSSALNPRFWYDVVSTVFYNLTFGFGSLITFTSYNKFNNDFFRDSIIIAFCNFVMVLLASVFIGSITGFLAYSMNVTFAEVITGGYGSFFITIPSAMTHIPAGAAWSALFFLFLMLIGYSTVLGYTETIITAFLDLNPKLHNFRYIFAVVISIILFLLTLPLSTNGGIFGFMVLDNYAYLYIFLMVLLQVIGIAYMYGLFLVVFRPRKYLQFKDDITFMFGSNSRNIWAIIWPIICFLWFLPFPVVLYMCWNYVTADLSNVTMQILQYVFPRWSQMLGLNIAFIPLLLAFLATVVMFFKRICFNKEKLSEALEYFIKPSSSWGPAEPVNREAYNDRLRS